jgi:hypothetical protein
VLDKFINNSSTSPAQILINKMLEDIAKRFVNLEFNETIAKTAFMDPRFKESAFGSENDWQKVKEKSGRNLINEERQHNEPSGSTSGSYSKDDDVNASDYDDSADKDLVWQQFDLMCKSTKIERPTALVLIEFRSVILIWRTVTQKKNSLEWWKSALKRMHEGLQIPDRKEVQEVTEKKLDVFGRAATSQKPRREAEDRGRTPNFQRELEVWLFSHRLERRQTDHSPQGPFRVCWKLKQLSTSGYISVSTEFSQDYSQLT